MTAGRYAPSPTGDLHVGNLRTAMLAWLFARHAGLDFLMRMEDLDDTAERALAGGQLDDLRAIGLDWDGPVRYQSDRLELYAAHLDRLEAEGATYPCYCSRREIREATSAPHDGPRPDGAYPGTCRDLTAAQRGEREAAGRPAALRLRADTDRLSFVDLVCGPTTAAVDDFVLRRGDGTPAYHLAVVVDDARTGVTQVVRGDDLLLSTPRHLHLADRLGLARPAHAHVPLVHNGHGDRLAKRDGAVALTDLAAHGWGPAEVRGRLATSLGLAEADELVTMDDLLARFDPDALPGRPWVFDPPAGSVEP